MNPTDSEAVQIENEAQIRQLIADWRNALCAKDLDRLLASYSPDILFFDATPPYQHKGADAYRRSWEACFPYLPASIGSEMQELNITVNDGIAFARCLHRITDLQTGEPATCNWLRVTICFRKEKGKWRVAHEHVSVPFDPQTSKASFISKP